MKSSTMYAMAFLSMVVPFTSPAVFAQGSLIPSGAPAPIFKTLDQVEPRTDLATVSGTTSNEVEITESGSYYLSTNLVVTKSVGIQVLASDVTIDLNGFTIERTIGGVRAAIDIRAGERTVTIKNGGIVGLSSSIFTWGIKSFTPLSIPIAEDVRVEHVDFNYCQRPIDLGDGILVDNCIIRGATQNAIVGGEGSVIRDSTISGMIGGVNGIFLDQGSTVSRCNLFSNDVSGALIDVSINSKVTDCSLSLNRGDEGIRGGRNTFIKDCRIVDNQLDAGIQTGQRSMVLDCLVHDNEGVSANSYGILAVESHIENCTVRFSGNTNSPTSSSQGVGIDAGRQSTVRNCTVYGNDGDGVAFAGECLITGNLAQRNGLGGGDGAGFYGEVNSPFKGSRIEGNTAILNSRGFDIDGNESFIVKNTAGGNSVNYEIAADNFVGTIYSPSNSFTITGGSVTGAVGVAVTENSTHFGDPPRDDSWANFSY